MSDVFAPIIPTPRTPPRFPVVPRLEAQNPALRAWRDYTGSPKRTAIATGFVRTQQGVLGTNVFPFRVAPVTDDTIEAVGDPAIHKRGRLSGWGEPPRITPGLDLERIQNALCAAERGETTLLFQIYRDFLLNGTHLQTEFGKRKMSVIGQPHSIKPWKAKGEKTAKPEDQKAADIIENMIETSENWNDAMVHMMDATLWPATVQEKIVEPNAPGYALYDDSKPWIRYNLRRLDPVSPFLFCYRLAYLAAGGFQLPNNPNWIAPNTIPMQIGRPGDTVWDPDTWEPDLRFFRTFPNGMIDYSWASIYAPDPMRHMVHRGNILSRSIRDNYGGVYRGVMFWVYFALIGRDWFARAQEKHGSPFPVVKANLENVDTLNMLKSAFQQASVIGGLLVNKDAEVQLVQAVSQNMANAYKVFLDFCNSEISKLILGHEGSSTAKAEGLNSNQEKTAKGASEMTRIFDQMMMRQTLQKQLFRWYLDINGFQNCHAPTIFWGGLSEEDASDLFNQIGMAHQAGLELTDESIDHLSEVCGMSFQRAPEPASAAGDPLQAKAKIKKKVVTGE